MTPEPHIRPPSTLVSALLVPLIAVVMSLPAVASEFDFERKVEALERGTVEVISFSARSSGHSGESGAEPVAPGVIDAELFMFGRALRLELRPFRIFAPGARMVRVTGRGRLESPAIANTYRGRVIGAAESVVAVSVEEGLPMGLIIADDDVYLIRQAAPIDGAAGRLVALHGSAASMGLVAEARAQALNVLEIAAVADFEYFELHGANTAAQIASVINQVDAVFKSELATSIRILTTVIYETSDDPFSDFDSGNLFNDFRNATTEFGNWRAAADGSVAAAGLGHLFSNKFDVNAGFGFIDALCDSTRGASLSTTNFVSLHPLIIEHEFGHNFGAEHDGEAGSSCADAPSGFIMAPSATGTEFSECSKEIMAANRDQAACITQEGITIFTDGFEQAGSTERAGLGNFWPD